MRLKVTAFLFFGLLLVGCQSKLGLEAQSEEWYVSRVVDGHTLVADRKGREAQIRLCGVEVPEDQSLGDTATVKLQELVEERYVMLLPVAQEQNYLVAEVFVEPTQGTDEMEQSVQGELLLAGLVQVSPSVDRCVNGEPMKMAEAIAQEQRVGVWDARLDNAQRD